MLLFASWLQPKSTRDKWTLPFWFRPHSAKTKRYMHGTSDQASSAESLQSCAAEGWGAHAARDNQFPHPESVRACHELYSHQWLHWHSWKFTPTLVFNNTNILEKLLMGLKIAKSNILGGWGWAGHGVVVVRTFFYKIVMEMLWKFIFWYWIFLVFDNGC